MKSVVCATLLAAASSTPPPNKLMLFKQFIKDHNRIYDSEFEEGRRFQIFSDNVDLIYSTNSKNKTYTLGITAHTDLTLEEWRGQYLGFKGKPSKKEGRSIFKAPAEFAEPDSVDWVAKGGVTSVKNQGQCGSCWSFSAVGALEGAMHVSGRTMVDLSMQHIIACDKTDNGCNGGLMDNAFDWVAENGVTSLQDEPYLCANGCSSLTCSGGCEKNTGGTCVFGNCTKGACIKTGLIHHCECPDDQCFADGECGAPVSPPKLVLAVGDVVKHTDVDQSESGLEAAVAQQPVSVAIEADTSVFQLYTGGVLTSEACGESLDHGVLAVGYGTDNGQKYWKIKNSWGDSWGEEGYIRIEKGASVSGGECGIRKSASFPTVSASGSIVV